MDNKPLPNGIVLTEAQQKSRRQRSIAIALALGVLSCCFSRSPWSRPGRARATDVIG